MERADPLLSLRKTDWPAHRHFCAAHKKRESSCSLPLSPANPKLLLPVLDTHESQILSKTTATTLREALHSYSTTSPIELFSALTASLGLFTPTPLSATHTLLIHLRYDPRSPDPSLRFLPTSLEILPHVDLRSRILASPRIAAGQGEFLNGLGEEAIRKREEFGGGRDDAVYAAAVFWCDEGWDESVVVTRFVELPIRGRKPDFKTQDSKRWEENYLRCVVSLEGREGGADHRCLGQVHAAVGGADQAGLGVDVATGGRVFEAGAMVRSAFSSLRTGSTSTRAHPSSTEFRRATVAAVT